MAAAPHRTIGSAEMRERVRGYRAPDEVLCVLLEPPLNLWPWTASWSGRLFVGSYVHSRNDPLLEELGITHVLSVTGGALLPPPRHHECIPLSDYGSTALLADETTTPVSVSTSEDEMDRPVDRIPSCESSAGTEDRFEAQKSLLSPQLRNSLCFIRKALRHGGRVLVHCSQGVNRSPTVVVAYLLCCEGFTLKDAYRRVEEARPQICLHERYFSALQRLEMQWYSLEQPTLSDEGRGPNLQDMLRLLAEQSPSTESNEEGEEVSSTAVVDDDSGRARSETDGQLWAGRKKPQSPQRRDRVMSENGRSPVILGQDAWRDVPWEQKGAQRVPGVVVGEETAAGMALADGLLGTLGDGDGISDD